LPDQAAKEWLLQRATERTTILRRLRLRAPDAEACAAVAALAARWADHPDVAAVLALARVSPHPEMRAAATAS
jgi:hypothetical protein